MEDKNTEKKKFPYFSICFCTVLAGINVYLFWWHPLGICIYWGILALFAMWNIKEAADSKTPAILVAWKVLQFALFIILTIAFANRDHVLATAGIVTLLLHCLVSTAFDCNKNKDNAISTILINIPFFIAYTVMIVSLTNNYPV